MSKSRLANAASMAKTMSSAAVFFEQLQADIKSKEQVTLAECDRILASKGGKKAKSAGTMNDAVQGTEAIRTWKEHKIGKEKLEETLKTNLVSGLTAGEAKVKHVEFGDNSLSKKDSKHWFCLFLEELTGFFSLLLWFGSALCFIGYGIQKDKEDKSNLYLGITLAVVTFVTGVFSYMQTSKSAEMMA